MPPSVGESLRQYTSKQKKAGKPITREGVKKAIARQMQKVPVPVKQSRAHRASRKPELRKGHKLVSAKTLSSEKAMKKAQQRLERVRVAKHTAKQRAVTASADAAASAAKKADKQKLKAAKNAMKNRKALIGGGAALAAYGAYRMHKRRKSKQQNETLDSEIQEIIMLAEEHFDYTFENIDDVIKALLEASDDYDDSVLVNDIELYLSQLAINEGKKKKKDDGDLKKAARVAVFGQHAKGSAPAGSEAGAVGAAGLAAGTYLGTKAAKAAWKAGKKAHKKGKLGKKIRKMAKSPYAKGAAAVATGIGAAELASHAAKRLMKRRRENREDR